MHIVFIMTVFSYLNCENKVYEFDFRWQREAALCERKKQQKQTNHIAKHCRIFSQRV